MGSIIQHDLQTGEPGMHVYYSAALSCWAWTCLWGCSGMDYEGEQEAFEAFLVHTCTG